MLLFFLLLQLKALTSHDDYTACYFIITLCYWHLFAAIGRITVYLKCANKCHLDNPLCSFCILWSSQFCRILGSWDSFESLNFSKYLSQRLLGFLKSLVLQARLLCFQETEAFVVGVVASAHIYTLTSRINQALPLYKLCCPFRPEHACSVLVVSCRTGDGMTTGSMCCHTVAMWRKSWAGLWELQLSVCGSISRLHPCVVPMTVQRRLCCLQVLGGSVALALK